MRLLATTPEPDLKRLPIAVDLRTLSLAEGLRAALSVAALVAANQWLQTPLLLEAAVGAMLTCLGDSGGPIRRRLPALLGFAAIGAAFTTGFSASRELGLVVSVPLACLGIFACAYARVWGQTTLQIGNLLIVVLVLAMDEPRPWHEALITGGVFALGSLWAALLTMVLWRIHPFRPARRAVSDAYRSTARLVADLRGLVETNAAPAEWEAHARGHRRAVRETIERARTAVQDTLRVRGGASTRAFQALIRIEAVDQTFGALIALSDLLEATPDPAVRADAVRLLRVLRPALIVVAEAVRADDPGRGGQAQMTRLAELAPQLDPMAEGMPASLAPITDAIVERLRMAITLTAPAAWQPGALPSADAPGPAWQRFLTPLLANLQWRSAVFRHALRSAAIAGPALTATLHLPGNYQHWLTITLVLTMQPFYALTWQRALERIGGTMLGGVVAAVVALVCTTPLRVAAGIFPLAVLAFTARAVNFGMFTALLTPMVVLLTEAARPGESEWLIAGYRALYTLVGGLLAVGGCVLLWPSWEPDRLRGELRTAIGAHAAFAQAEMDVLLDEGSPAAVDAARRAAGVASNNLEAAISRALNEPRRNQRRELQSAMVVDAALRRMAGRLSALQLDPHGADGAGQETLRRWRGWIDDALRALAADGAVPAARPPGKAPDALLRIARQIELLDGTRRA